MAEYIEREKIVELSKILKDEFAPLHREVINAFIYNIDKNIPTADVVEVVRCKDCLFGHKEHDYKCGYICKKPLYYPAIGEIPHMKLMQDCDYCSHGVRRKGD